MVADFRTKISLPRLLCFAGLAICLVISGVLLPQLIVRYSYQQGEKSLRKGEISQAEADLSRAESLVNTLSLQSDINRISLAQGNIAIDHAENASNLTQFLENMQQAEELFRNVVATEPRSLVGYTGLVRATAALERVYPFVHRIPYERSALVDFEHLVRLMPTNLYTNTLLIKYYNSKGMEKERAQSIGYAVSLKPSLYNQLKRQTYYSLDLNEMLKESLHQALENGVYVVDALKALSDIAVLEGDYPAAINYYLQAKPVTPYKDHSRYYYQLGRLYLKAKKPGDAIEPFLESIKTKDKEKRLEEIYRSYLRHDFLYEFLGFTKEIESSFLSEKIEILRAKSLIKLDKYGLALSHLIRIDSGRHYADSLYLQGEIAKLQKDWDTMELRSQKAIVLDSQNSSYHLMFSQALKQQKKWPQAEKAASDAINCSDGRNPWLYNHRAWIRWSRQDYNGAQDDWRQAITINPKNGWFYQHMALVFEKGKNFKQALRYIDKAISLKPDEQRFIAKREELLKKQSLTSK